MSKKFVIAIYVFIVAGPLILGFGYSLLYSIGALGSFSEGVGLRHWMRFFSESQGLESILYTLLLAVLSLILSAVLALEGSYKIVLGEKDWGRLSKWLFIPLCFPPIVAGFAFFHVLSPSGWISRFSYWLGLSVDTAEFPRLVNDRWAIGIIIAQLFVVAPFLTVWFTSLAKQLKMKELQELTYVLGGSTSDFNRSVYYPLMLLKGRSILLLYGIFLFGTYEIPLLLGRQSPLVVTQYITEQTQRYDLANIPLGHVMAVIYVLIVGMLSWAFMRKSDL